MLHAQGAASIMRAMKLLLRLMLVLVAGAVVVAQEPANGFRERAIAMTRDALRTHNSHALLGRLLQYAPKRLAGSPGAKDAAEWGVAEMKAIGLKNVHLEEVTVPVWDMGAVCRVQVLHADGTVTELRALPLGGSEPTPQGGVEAEVLAVKSFGQLRALGDAAKGKLIFFARPFDTSLLSAGQAYGESVVQRGQGAIEAAKVGGVGALVRSAGSGGLEDDFPHTGAMNYADDGVRVPACALSVKAAEALNKALDAAAGKPVRVRWVQDCANKGTGPGWNVVGDIPGALTPQEIVLIGGHIDAWPAGDGAHDDGAGCAHVLEAARIILGSGAAPRRTVRCVLFANEENGLAGGKGYALQHLAELPQHVAALESDAGGFAPRGVGVGGGKAQLEAMADLALHLQALNLGTVKPGGGGADISPMAAHGVPQLSLEVAGERYFDLHHTAKDKIENVHPRELALGAAVLGITALHLADAPTNLPRQAAK